jgi:hypothetical protein
MKYNLINKKETIESERNHLLLKQKSNKYITNQLIEYILSNEILDQSIIIQSNGERKIFDMDEMIYLIWNYITDIKNTITNLYTPIYFKNDKLKYNILYVIETIFGQNLGILLNSDIEFIYTNLYSIRSIEIYLKYEYNKTKSIKCKTEIIYALNDLFNNYSLDLNYPEYIDIFNFNTKKIKFPDISSRMIFPDLSLENLEFDISNEKQLNLNESSEENTNLKKLILSLNLDEAILMHLYYISEFLYTVQQIMINKLYKPDSTVNESIQAKLMNKMPPFICKMLNGKYNLLLIDNSPNKITLYTKLYLLIKITNYLKFTDKFNSKESELSNQKRILVMYDTLMITYLYPRQCKNHIKSNYHTILLLLKFSNKIIGEDYLESLNEELYNIFEKHNLDDLYENVVSTIHHHLNLFN